MFCPDGYVSFYDTVEAFGEFGRDWWRETGMPARMSEIRSEIARIEDAGGDASNRIDLAYGPDDVPAVYAYQRWAIHRMAYRHRDRFVFSSPVGTVMRLCGAAFESHRMYDGPFPTTNELQVDLIQQVESGFFHLTEYYGTIRPCADDDTVAAYGLEAEVKLLSAFEGWAVCWKPKNFENWRSELRALLEDAGQSAPAQRIRLADERHTAKQIVAAFDQDDQITKDKCKERGIGAALGPLAFGRAWAEAGKERPALLAPGRRKSKPPI